MVLPDHLHWLIELPPGSADFSSRIGMIKAAFTRTLSPPDHEQQPTSASRRRRREGMVWQRRFWEHTIRDERDFEMHMNYVHYNPVKHGHATCPHLWPYSSFSRWVREGLYPADWACVCDGRARTPPDFDEIATTTGE